MSGRKEKIVSLDEAVKTVKDGSIIAVGGYLNHNSPMTIIRKIIQESVKDLFIITPTSAGVDADLLIGAGCVRTIFSCYVGAEWLAGVLPNFRRKVEAGEIEVKECDEFHIIASLRAASENLPFYPTRTGLGTDLPKVNKDFKEFTDPVKGEKLLAVPAYKPDVAIIHAQKSDPYGNIQHAGSRFLDYLMAKAAKKTIVTVEEIIPHEQILAEPFKTSIPSFLVDYVVRMSWGAHPCSCHGYYNMDEEHIKTYIEAARKPEDFRKYLEEYVYKPKNHEEYLEKIGLRKLLSLRVF